MAPESVSPGEDEGLSADHIDSAFNFLRRPGREWALDFLMAYDSDAAGDISGLSNSVSYSQGEASMCFVVASPVPLSPDSSQRQGEHAESDSPQGSFAIELNFLSIPVWQAGGICVGVSIQQIVGRYGNSNKFLRLPGAEKEPRALGVGRFALEEATGAYTAILVTSSSGVATSQGKTVHLSHRVLEGTRKVRRSIYQCDFDSLSTQSKHPSSFVGAVLMLKQSESSRACPVCNVPSDRTCSCSFGFQEGKGGLDFQFFRKNSSLLYGTEAGKVSSRQRARLDDTFRLVTMFLEGTSAAREGGSCFDSLSISLRNLVIQDKISSSGQVLRGVSADQEETPDHPMPDVSRGTSPGQQPRSARTGPQLGELFEEPVFLDFAQALERGSADFPFLAIGDKEKGFDNEVSVAGPSMQADETDRDIVFPRTSHGEEGDTLERGSDLGAEHEDSFEVGAGGSEALDTIETAADAERRKAIRKLRNRAAAARSNQRRKEKLEELRDDLRTVRQKRDELQERQKELLTENSYLRERVLSLTKSE